MAEPTIIGPGEGEVIGDAPDRRVEILSDHDSLHATWSRFGPRRAGANLHIHYRHSDLFYVLQGELTVKLGPDGDETVAPAGTLVRIPPLVVHGFRNGSDAEVRYLNFHAPGQGFADYMRGLSDFDQDEPPADGSRAASEAGIARGDELLADFEEIAVAVLTGAPDGAHVHREHAESFYVLDGVLDLTIGDRQIRAGAGTWLQVPAGVPHAVAGAGRYLDVHTPGFGLGARDQREK
jgi:mannose-6-phosphate isomerase-like protein (cupin superfamily)